MINTYKYSKKSIIAFFAIVILLSAVTETLICTGGPEWLYIVLMWIPALAAITANCVSFREEHAVFSLKRLAIKSGFGKCAIRYIFMGMLIPLFYLLVPYIIYWVKFPDNFAYSGVAFWIILKDLLPIMIIGTFISLVSAIGEEIGWRGFMVPALYERMGINKALLISSLFWCCWHIPLLIGGDYMAGTPLWYQIPAFVLCIFPVGIIMGILTVKSGSVLPAAFLHAAHNNYDQAVFDVITKGTDKMYYVSETGIFTILCVWTVAVIMYIRIKKTDKSMKNRRMAS